jgi:hypothetical protein
MAWCAHRRRRSSIVPLYCSQIRVSRRCVPYLEPGGAPCPSRNSRRRVGWPGPTGLTATTTSRRRGLTCLRSVRRVRAAPRDLAIRPVRRVRAAPRDLAIRLVRRVRAAPREPAIRPVLAAHPVLSVRPVLAIRPVLSVCSVPSVPAAPLHPLTPLSTPAPTAAPVTSAILVRMLAALAHTGSPIRFRTNRFRSGPSGMNPRTTPRPPRRPGPASPAGGRCGPRRAGGGGGTT